MCEIRLHYIQGLGGEKSELLYAGCVQQLHNDTRTCEQYLHFACW